MARQGVVVARRVPFEAIPVVDLAPWFDGDEKVRQELARRLGDICQNVGFFYVRNHGVPQRGIADTFQAAKRFFALPEDRKTAIHFTKARKQRGYIPLRAESTDPDAAGDVKEALDFTFPTPPPTPLKDVNDPAAFRMYGPNLWPSSLPGFRQTIEAYFEEMIGLGRTLFEVFAVSLGLSPLAFRDKTDRPIAQLRLLHYPPQPGPVDPSRLGIGAHCDYECFTILAQGEVGGLQVRNPAGEWVEASPIPGTFVVNLGEMLARWTNDVFTATPHRVINRAGQERYSVPFFFGTNYDAVIESLETCCSPARPSRYPPVKGGHYLAKRLQEIYGSSAAASPAGEAESQRKS